MDFELFDIIILVVILIVLRLFGAWMLRINEVIELQREMLEEIKKLNGPNENK